MTVTVNHAKTNAISDWTQAQLDEQIALGNFAPGTTLADIVLPSDWNNDHTLTGLGTMAEQNANSVAITGGSVNGTTIGATTASTGRFTTLDTTGQVNFNSSSATSAFLTRLNTNGQTSGYCEYAVTDGTRFAEMGLAVSTTSSYGAINEVYFRGSGQTSATVISSASATTPQIKFITGASGSSTEQVRIANTASAVNYVQVTGSATTARPVISAQGSDTNVSLDLNAKGVSALRLQSGSANIMRLNGVSSAVNYFDVYSSATTQVPQFKSEGTDTNISMAFQPKGTGAINLAAGSRGVNISNGGTVTAITRTATGSAYSSAPTVTVSPPTTAGGVQATANALMGINIIGIVSGGTGYTLNNVLTLVGGTGTVATLTVTGVTGGVINAVTVGSFGSYSVVPTNNISVTGGTGTGATFTSTWAVGTVTVGTAGSGYIEQPTITFSGGGGSGAAAYATVGSATVIRSMAGTPATASMSFHTPSSITSNLPAMRIMDGAAGYDTYVTIQPASAYTTISAVGNSGANLFLNSTGAGSIRLMTGGNSLVEQMRVSNTASAVNFVQVTGSATNQSPSILMQGSDANISAVISTKGTGGLSIYTNGISQRQARFTHTASAVNFLDFTGSIAGAAVPIAVSSSSTDTNVDLALTPKGTGLVRFGTYVAGALTATGYINIKAADGTTYKVLVST